MTDELAAELDGNFELALDYAQQHIDDPAKQMQMLEAWRHGNYGLEFVEFVKENMEVDDDN